MHWISTSANSWWNLQQLPQRQQYPGIPLVLEIVHHTLCLQLGGSPATKRKSAGNASFLAGKCLSDLYLCAQRRQQEEEENLKITFETTCWQNLLDAHASIQAQILPLRCFLLWGFKVIFGLDSKAIRVILYCVIFLVKLLSGPEYFFFFLNLREGYIWDVKLPSFSQISSWVREERDESLFQIKEKLEWV